MKEMDYPDFTLAGQVAFITGASKGIGFGVARALAHAGARVAVAARSSSDLEMLVEEIRAEGGDASRAVGARNDRPVVRVEGRVVRQIECDR